MQNIILGFIVTLLVSVGWNVKQAFDIKNMEAAALSNRASYAEELAKAQQSVKDTQTMWSERLIEAERKANEQIQTINIDARNANDRANSLSKQLSEANKRLSVATRTAAIEYASATNELLETCVGEYRFMAEKADGHAIDAGRLRSAWPQEKAP